MVYYLKGYAVCSFICRNIILSSLFHRNAAVIHRIVNKKKVEKLGTFHSSNKQSRALEFRLKLSCSLQQAQVIKVDKLMDCIQAFFYNLDSTSIPQLNFYLCKIRSLEHQSSNSWCCCTLSDFSILLLLLFILCIVILSRSFNIAKQGAVTLKNVQKYDIQGAQCCDSPFSWLILIDSFPFQKLLSENGTLISDD